MIDEMTRQIEDAHKRGRELGRVEGGVFIILLFAIFSLIYKFF